MNERWARQYTGWAAFGVQLIGLFLLFTSSAVAEDRPNLRSLTSDVSIAENAYIEWNFPLSEPNAGELARIRYIFVNAISDAAIELGSAGNRNLLLRVEVTRLDILSRMEILFCCARNEVSAIYELTDLQTGEVVKPREEVSFDHFGRGGVIALMSAAGGEDQLTHLQNTIRDGTLTWIRE